MRFIYFFLPVILLLTSCSNDDIDTTSVTELSTVIRNTESYTYYLGFTIDIETSTIETEPLHAQVSRLGNVAQSSYLAYNYRPEADFVGKERIKIVYRGGDAINYNRLNVLYLNIEVVP